MIDVRSMLFSGLTGIIAATIGGVAVIGGALIARSDKPCGDSPATWHYKSNDPPEELAIHIPPSQPSSTYYVYSDPGSIGNVAVFNDLAPVILTPGEGKYVGSHDVNIRQPAPPLIGAAPINATGCFKKVSMLILMIT